MTKYKSGIIILLVIFSIFNIGMVFAAQKGKVIKNQTLDKETLLYQKAQQDLTPRFYQAYRITERLARANKLDNYSWRILSPKSNEYLDDYKINASSSNANLIILTPGFTDTFSGEISALAFVIAHEMAHQIHKDIPKMMRYREQLGRQLQDEVGASDFSDNSNRKDFGIGDILSYYYIKKTVEKNKELEKKQEELEYDYLAELRRQEYEADKEAIIYITRAGFDPQAAIRVLELFKRKPRSTDIEKMGHPTPENRIWQVDKLIKTLNLQALKNEGKRNLLNSKPLSYEKTIHKTTKYFELRSIVIHSKYGYSEDINEPFKKLFGK